jgi:hypothetical protein
MITNGFLYLILEGYHVSLFKVKEPKKLIQYRKAYLMVNRIYFSGGTNFTGWKFLIWEPTPDIDQIIPHAFSLLVSKITFRIFNPIPFYSGKIVF